jgi:hypothetical protein
MGRLEPGPDFVCFLGDMIWGITADNAPPDPAVLRGEWDRALSGPMAPLSDLRVPVYRIAGNHDTFEPISEGVWREVFPDLPTNGPSGQEGLSYFVRRGHVLIIALNVYATAMGGLSPVFGGRIDTPWVDRVLSDHDDTRFKLVLGHTPVFPVNGYRERLWNVSPEFADPFWDVLVRHGVTAYLCSHVIAFDVQVHRDVLQISSGGAGTSYGPEGCMPGSAEYHHLVQMAVDDGGVRGQVLDTTGEPRETFSWPFAGENTRVWRFMADEVGQGPSRLLLAGETAGERFPRVRVSLDGWSPKLNVSLYDPRDRHPRTWAGPEVRSDGPLDVTVALCPGMGPGGVLARVGDGPYSSLQTDGATGYTAEGWPDRWTAGDGVEVIEA